MVDLETTGGSAGHDTITEIGAVKVRGGETLGTFATLVDPGGPIPPGVTHLTGISTAMVATAPRIEEVLPALTEFLGTGEGAATALVGHNVGFDASFLSAALSRHDRPPPAHPRVDTLMLARRLLGDEVPNHRLGTLADRLGLPNRPEHRALSDALATTDLLHVLLERASGFGVERLDDLLDMPALTRGSQRRKLHLTHRLPRRAGVYLFRDRTGTVLHVGAAADVRPHVRRYFSTDDPPLGRRRTSPLLREVARIDHKSCTTTLEAQVLAVRLRHHLRPDHDWRRRAPLDTAPDVAQQRVDELTTRARTLVPAAGQWVELRHGMLWSIGASPDPGAARTVEMAPTDLPGAGRTPTPAQRQELAVVASWLDGAR